MAEPISIQQLKDASLDAKSLEEVVNGNEAKQVTTRLGENYPSVKKAIKTLFENGGLPATPFATKALMTASALVDGDYAQVTDDTVNNGLYVKTVGAWVKSAYDPLALAKIDATTKADAAKADAVVDSNTYTDSALSKVAVVNTDETYSHVFTDKDDRLLAFFDGKGNFDFNPTDATVEKLSVSVKNDDNDDFIYLVLDAENRIVDGIDKLGNKVIPDEIDIAIELPVRTPLKDMNSTVSVKEFTRTIQKMDINTVAKGRSTDPDIIVNGNGLTHPKMIYIPAGWNGYRYWLAATPVYGVIPSDAYENPHVFASNDLVNWVEPAGAPLDLPEEGNDSYWSDTHLALDDDGWLYCIYRGCYFSFAETYIVAKRSRDGVNWSDRIPIYDSSIEPVKHSLLSPAVFKNGNKWELIDVMTSGRNFVFPTDNGRGVVRRSANIVTGTYEPYSIDNIVNYVNPIWGDETKAPWHIDAVVVGNLHLHLLAVGLKTQSRSEALYLAWSTDGWNFNVLPKLDTSKFSIYRSCLSLKEARNGELLFDVIVARTDTGEMDLYTLTLEIN